MENNKCRFVMALFSAMLFCLVTVLPASAGWFQVDGEGEKAWISDGKMKFQSPGEPQWMAFDLNKETVTLVKPDQKIYARAPIETYCGILAQFSQSMDEMGATFGGESGKPSNIEVSHAGSGGKIAGFDTEKYKVTVNGELYEEIWLADAAVVLEEIVDADGFEPLVKCMSDGDTVEASPDYLALSKKGWELKSVSHDMGMAEVETEIVKLAEKSIPASAFEPPAGFTEVSLEQIFGMGP